MVAAVARRSWFRSSGRPIAAAAFLWARRRRSSLTGLPYSSGNSRSSSRRLGCLLCHAQISSRVRQQVHCPLRCAGLRVLQDHSAMPHTVVHLRNGLVDVELPLLEVEVSLAESQRLPGTQRTCHGQQEGDASLGVGVEVGVDLRGGHGVGPTCPLRDTGSAQGDGRCGDLAFADGVALFGEGSRAPGEIRYENVPKGVGRVALGEGRAQRVSRPRTTDRNLDTSLLVPRGDYSITDLPAFSLAPVRPRPPRCSTRRCSLRHAHSPSGLIRTARTSRRLLDHLGRDHPPASGKEPCVACNGGHEPGVRVR